MIKILEARMNSHFVAVPFLKGRIHSRFNRAINIEFTQKDFQTRLITVLYQGNTGVPDSLVVDNSAFASILKLPVGTAVQKSGLEFIFEGMDETLNGYEARLQSDFISVIDLQKDTNRLSRALEYLKSYGRDGKRKDGFSRIPVFARQQILQKLSRLCRTMHGGDVHELEKDLSLCIGMGCGLTPSSDDAVVGILAAGRSGLLGSHVPPLDNMKIWHLLEGQTTDVSRKYLCCAVEGRFSDVLVDVLTAFIYQGEPEWEQCIQALVQVGSTSGMDMLRGIEIAFQETLNYKSEKTYSEFFKY